MEAGTDQEMREKESLSVRGSLVEVVAVRVKDGHEDENKGKGKGRKRCVER